MKKLFTALVLICLVALPLLAAPKTSWEIIRADYGSGNNWVDVTERVRALVQGDSLNINVNANTLGADSRRGRNRTLRLQLKDINGKNRQITYRDSQQVNLQVYTANQGTLRISRATYGSGNRSFDVTSRLNSQIQRAQLTLQVNSDSMGGDPAPGQSKTLAVEYTLNGRNARTTVRDGYTLRLPYSDSNNGNLQINRAMYGIGNRSSDVTSRLNSQIQGDQLNVQVNNHTMGGDPAPGQAKTLTVEYTLNGRDGQSTFREGDMLSLSYSNTSNGMLQINSAVYGSGSRSFDVTSRLNSQIQADHLDLQVNNNTMGGDPAPNQAKTLSVQYVINGQRDQAVINEGDMLRLPYNDYNGNNSNIGNGLSQRVRCESLQSSGYRRNYCAADTRGGVRLSRRLSDSDCIEGSSWGYDNGGVWVDKGCRADFELQGNGRYTGGITSTTIPNGSELSVRTNETIDSNTSTVGQTFSAMIATDVLDSFGSVKIPRGSDAQLVIRSASGGSITSASDLVLDVNSLTISGTKYLVSTGDLVQQGGQGVGANQKTAIMVGGGAALGTLIGAIVGGGKGAAIGAAIGAGAGLGTEVLTKGKQVRVPAETLLSFRLDQDLRLQAAR